MKDGIVVTSNCKMEFEARKALQNVSNRHGMCLTLSRSSDLILAARRNS